MKRKYCGGSNKNVLGWLLDSNFSGALNASGESGEALGGHEEQYLPPMEREQCRRYFERQAARRWLQSASASDFLGQCEVAHRIADGRLGPEGNVTEAALL